jgi:hypothetical protein
VSTIDPRQFRAGVEWIKSAHVLAPARGSLVHAEWSPRRYPPRFLYATTSHEVHSAWCGTRLRLILTEMFDPTAEGVCPSMHRGIQAWVPRGARSERLILVTIGPKTMPRRRMAVPRTPGLGSEMTTQDHGAGLATI